MIEGLIDRKGKVSDQGGDVWIIFFFKYEVGWKSVMWPSLRFKGHRGEVFCFSSLS